MTATMTTAVVDLLLVLESRANCAWLLPRCRENPWLVFVEMGISWTVPCYKAFLTATRPSSRRETKHVTARRHQCCWPLVVIVFLVSAAVTLLLDGIAVTLLVVIAVVFLFVEISPEAMAKDDDDDGAPTLGEMVHVHNEAFLVKKMMVVATDNIEWHYSSVVFCWAVWACWAVSLGREQRAPPRLSTESL
jgi:hypothetical protein